MLAKRRCQQGVDGLIARRQLLLPRQRMLEGVATIDPNLCTNHAPLRYHKLCVIGLDTCLCMFAFADVGSVLPSTFLSIHLSNLSLSLSLCLFACLSVCLSEAIHLLVRQELPASVEQT